MIFGKQHSIDFKRRTFFLLVSVVLLYFLAYRFAIRETLKIRARDRELKHNIERLQDASARIAHLEQSLDHIQNLLGHYYGGSTDIQEDILNDLTVYCQKNHLVIRELPATHSIRKMGYQLETCQVIVEGRFVELLGLIHHLETKFYKGGVLSASFIKKTDLRTRRNYLLLKVFIQNIKKSSNEKA